MSEILWWRQTCDLGYDFRKYPCKIPHIFQFYSALLKRLPGSLSKKILRKQETFF